MFNGLYDRLLDFPECQACSAREYPFSAIDCSAKLAKSWLESIETVNSISLFFVSVFIYSQ